MKQLCIYCDGGFGNRYNALVSGLALGTVLNLEPLVYWPCNNWCRAPFNSLFASRTPFVDCSLTGLKGKIGHLTPLLHDELGAQSLGVAFKSAYTYASHEDVRLHALACSDGIFYYPALIPDWIPRDALASACRTLCFHSDLTEKATHFINHSLGRPYYGIHLRRTDLQIGLSDEEVKKLVQRQPQALFFVCSDDPLAERLAAVHDNVRIRSKSNHVTKRESQSGWNDLTLDEDQRPYYSNIDRGVAAVREAVIDLLILAHSTIVGFTGSTFQSVARLIGQTSPLLPLERLPELDFPALRDCLRQLAAGGISLLELIGLSERLLDQDRGDDGLLLLQTAINHYSGADAFPILYNLSVGLFNNKRYGESEAFIERALQSNPDCLDAYLVAVQICRSTGRHEQAFKYLTEGMIRSHAQANTEKFTEFARLMPEIQPLIQP